MRDWFSARTYAGPWPGRISSLMKPPTAFSARGHAGEELVNIFGLAMRFGSTATQIKDTVYAYPTFSSDIKHML
jgi:glutathione reductase (NADPH)